MQSDKHQDGSHLAVEEITSTRGCCGGDEAGGQAKSVKAEDATGVKRRWVTKTRNQIHRQGDPIHRRSP